MRPKFIDFNGFRFRLSGNYYRKNGWSQKGPTNLHRAIWEFHFGEIPKDYEIHHKDGDTFNNDISNLSIVPISEHQRAHTKQRQANGSLLPPGKLARERAKEWHQSKEGREWHKQHGKDAWVNRVWHECVCQECGQKFMSPYPTRAKFCHLNCKMFSLRRRRGQNVGVRPDSRKPRLLSGKRNPSEQQ